MDYDDIFYNYFKKRLYDLEDLDGSEYIDEDKSYKQNENEKDILTNDDKVRLLEYFKYLKSLKESPDDIDVLRKLFHIKNSISDEDPRELEDKIFSEYDPLTEKQKIILEAQYIRGLMLNDKSMQLNKNYKVYLQYTDSVIKRIQSNSKINYRKVKQDLLIIEVDLGIDISFYTEVEGAYQSKLEKIIKKKKGL